MHLSEDRVASGLTCSFIQGTVDSKKIKFFEGKKIGVFSDDRCSALNRISAKGQSI